ncbi:type II toxin-antitoxin system VapC family toxin [Janibacter cremeus]|uniref:type II toxin-antitoxin system VapC family toxin n=1 Tax=Janibacter cremeus TaxID=1285192 RepID=UPI0023F7CD0D|nr:type II toxin-antitoxin system VapC family toxin [Janibacter cremeus]WEV78822.1 type II toxin-antitoxin system VapC family toxin [Janibacter cremeus]
MIIDTSALVAIITGEPEADRLLTAIAEAESARMSAATYVECAIVIDRRSSPATRRRFDQLLTTLEIGIADLTADQAQIAREAHRDFGRGSEGRARLNLGDCYSYALAVASDDELLFQGDDFSATDIVAARY